MPLSPRIIKAQNYINQRESKSIHTEILLEMPLKEMMEHSPEWEEYTVVKRQVDKMIADAEEEKVRILESAHQEAESILTEASKSGYLTGEKRGSQEGFQQGYQTGMQQALEEVTELKKYAHQRLVKATEYVAEYYMEKKNEVVELAAQMAEKIIHEKIDRSDQKIINLITPVLRRMNQQNQFITLSVPSEHEALVKERMKTFEKEHPQFRFAVFCDDTLEKNGCIIESSQTIVDQQVRKQLDAMVIDLQQMEG